MTDGGGDRAGEPPVNDLGEPGRTGLGQVVERVPDELTLHAEAADDTGADTDDGQTSLASFAVSVLLPGWAAMRRRPILGILLLLGGVVLPFAFVAWVYSRRSDLIGFALDEDVLLLLVVVGVLGVLTRLVAVGEVAVATRRTTGVGWRTALAMLVVLLLGVPVSWAVYHGARTRDAVLEVFSDASDAPLFVPSAGDGDAFPADDATGEAATETDSDPGTDPGTASEPGEGPSSGAADDVDAPSKVTTILLLGGDAGPGRWGMRTDSMILFSVDEASGRTALISVPRNLMNLRFPPGTPLAERFPNGFDDLANAVFTHVTTRADLVEAYGANGERPEVVALAQGIGYSLGVQIDDYVLVNLVGFRDAIDAVGGVTVEVPKRVLLQRSNPTALYELPDAIGPGKIDMDGTLAIAYARARRGDSDYYRMERQRQLLAALGSQVSTMDAIRAFPSLSRVLGDSLRTSLSAGEFSDLLDDLGDSVSIGESVGLTPPLISTGRPDYAQIQAIIDAVERYVRTGEPSGYGD